MTEPTVKAADIIALHDMLQRAPRRHSVWIANPAVPPEDVAFMDALSDPKVWAEWCKLK